MNERETKQFYRRVLGVRITWSVAIGALIAGMIGLCLVVANEQFLVDLTVSGVLGIGVGLGVLVKSRTREASDEDGGCQGACSNCTATGSQGCLATFDHELAGRIAAFDAQNLAALGSRMRGVLAIPVLLMVLCLLVSSPVRGVVPLTFALVALVSSGAALAMMRIARTEG